MPNYTFLLPPFLALVPHKISVLSYYSTLVYFSLSSSWWCVCACVGMCVCLQSNCSSLETSERAASGVINCHFRLSPFFAPPFFYFYYFSLTSVLSWNPTIPTLLTVASPKSPQSWFPLEIPHFYILLNYLFFYHIRSHVLCLRLFSSPPPKPPSTNFFHLL